MSEEINYFELAGFRKNSLGNYVMRLTQVVCLTEKEVEEARSLGQAHSLIKLKLRQASEKFKEYTEAMVRQQARYGWLKPDYEEVEK